MKKIISILTAAALLLGITGCSSETLKTGSLVAWSKADVPEKERLNILYEEFEKEYLFTLDYNNIDAKDNTLEEFRKKYRESVINNLVTEKILLYVAWENGIDASTLTSEQLSTVEKTVQAGLESWYDSFKSQAQSELGSNATEQEIRTRSIELFREYLKGFNLTEDDFYTWETNIQIKQLLYDKLLGDIDVTQEEIEAMYQNILKEAKDAYESSPAYYEQYDEYQYFFIPEDSRLIKHILFMLDPEDINQIESLREVGNDKKADALLEEKLAEIKPKAEEVLKKLQDGADFDTLMKEHSQDPGLEAYPDGYLIVPNSTRWVESFYKTSISLEKVGDISGLVNSDYGYHIIQYAADRTLTDEDKKEGMEMAKSIALNQKRSEETSKLMNSWDERFKMEVDYEKLDLKKPEETTSK